MHKRTALPIVALAFVAACGGSTTSDADVTTTTTTATPATTAEATTTTTIAATTTTTIAALQPLPLTPFEASDPLVGTYVKMPADNGFHIGGITVAPGGGYQWTNQSYWGWSLTWDETQGLLVGGEDNPYGGEEYEGAGDAFEVHFDGDGMVTGFTFFTELYEKVSDLPFGAIGESQMAGTYVHSPIENEWHTGDLTIEIDPFDPELEGRPALGGLRWTNLAGISWTLTWDPMTGRLDIHEGNQYPEFELGDVFFMHLGTWEDGSLGVLAFEYLEAVYTHLG